MRKLRIITAIMALVALSTTAWAQTTVQDTVCVGATSVDYWVTKTTGSTYNWTLTGGGTIISGNGTDSVKIDWSSTTGTDTLKVTETNSHFCVGDPVALAITRVAAPIANAGSDASIGSCAGQSTTLDGSGSTGAGTLTYSWAPATGLSATNIVNPVASPTTTTTYTLTVNSSFGCSSTDDVVVTVDAAPLAITAANDTIGSCAGQSTNIDGSSSTGNTLGYSWSSSPVGFTSTSATASVGPTVTTTYTLTVTDTYGCTDTEQQIIVVEAAPVALATTNKDTIGSCAGQSATLSASTSTGLGLTYSWTSSPAGFTSSNVSPVASPTVTTTYTLVVTDKFSCTDNNTVTVTVDAAPVADAGANDTICNGSTTALDATASTGSNLSYSWTSSPVGFTSSSSTPNVSPTATTTYTVVVTDKNGCTDTDNMEVKVYDGPTANAGSDMSVCEGETASLTGTATNYTSILWSSNGDGTFSNNGTLTPDYTPGSTDVSNQTVNITITVSGNGPCVDASDVMVITINPKPVTTSIFHF
jgi:hypothetical protein